MTKTDPKIAIAKAAIIARYGAPEAELNVNLFASHHKEELAPAEWQACLGDSDPSEQRILEGLVLRDIIPIPPWHSISAQNELREKGNVKSNEK